jgi:hypothetical protein
MKGTWQTDGETGLRLKSLEIDHQTKGTSLANN